jgi:hypothetical protein
MIRSWLKQIAQDGLAHHGSEPAPSLVNIRANLRKRKAEGEPEGDLSSAPWRVNTFLYKNVPVLEVSCSMSRARPGLGVLVPPEADKPSTWKACKREDCGFMCTGFKSHDFCCDQCRESGGHGSRCRQIPFQAREILFQAKELMAVEVDAVHVLADRTFENTTDFRKLEFKEQVRIVAAGTGFPHTLVPGIYGHGSHDDLARTVIWSPDGLSRPCESGEAFGPISDVHIQCFGTSSGQPELSAKVHLEIIELIHKGVASVELFKADNVCADFDCDLVDLSETGAEDLEHEIKRIFFNFRILCMVNCHPPWRR